MEKRPNYSQYEAEIYQQWEKSGYFNPDNLPGERSETYTIVLPPPNASGKMHTGNVLMIAIEDLLIRWKRMKGFKTLWIPGTDHAGFETQTTFEKKLAKEGKTRFDFDRKTLYDKMMAFVLENKGLIENQIRQMGASVDWSRYTFTLDEKSIETVVNTFKKMEEDGMIYRADYLVNYSFKWGTTFSDAEISYKKQTTPLYFVRYPLVNRAPNEPEYIAIATTRPEPIFVDTHAAVHPQDESKKHLIGRKILNPLTNQEMTVIADDFVDPEFGTGVVKLTPAHDKNDYEVAKKHNLPIISAITLEGTINDQGGELAGLSIKDARKKAVEILTAKNLIEKINSEYENLTPVDYRSGDYIEQLILPNWFVKTESLKTPALASVQEKKIRIFPNWREITYVRWMENMHDWAISRQVVWGIRIPAWYNVDENPNLQVTFLNNKQETVTERIQTALQSYSLEEIEKGLQTLIAPNHATYVVNQTKPSERYLQETDTFDTWFSSGQWPLITLGYPDSDDFKTYYPTNVLETGWEIITRWVSRMVMFGYYLTGEKPFFDVYLHGLVRAIDGRKMSKSLGNVINPEEYMEEYGVDALRMGLISGTANGKDFNFPHDKIVGYKKFITKIWNMARFILLMRERQENRIPDYSELANDSLAETDRLILEKLAVTIKAIDTNLEKYRFDDAAELLYQFVWHDIADNYLEDVKNRENAATGLSVLTYVFTQSLKLLHPFMPFVTEKIYQSLKEENAVASTESSLIMVAEWPKVNNN